jgi:hypothetical protein
MNHILFCVALCLCLISRASAQTVERIEFPFAEQEGWKLAHNQKGNDNGTTTEIFEYLRKGEKLNKWKQMVTVFTLGIRLPDIAVSPKVSLATAQKACPTVQQRVLERFEVDGYPAILFVHECERYEMTDHVEAGSESQVYCHVQGRTRLFMCHVSVKEKRLDQAFIDKWTSFFKELKVVSE